MAHNLNYNSKTDRHSFFSVKQKAWHSLGTIIEDYPTSAEAIKHAGLDYNVEKRGLFIVDNSVSGADGGKILKRKSPHRAGQFGTKQGGYFY